MKNVSHIQSVINGLKTLSDVPHSTSFPEIIARTIETVKNDVITFVGPYAFYDCISLRLVDLPSVNNIGKEAFSGCASLAALILRKTDGLCTIASYAFDQSSTSEVINGELVYIRNDNLIAKGDGYIYVPRALIEDYKVAENWSSYASQFRALEDYTVDGTVTGELDETKIQ